MDWFRKVYSFDRFYQVRALARSAARFDKAGKHL